MGPRGPLGASHTSQGKTVSRMIPFPARAAFIAAAAMLLCSCSLPRVMVMDDPLTPQEHLKLGMSYELDGEMELAEKEYLEAADEMPLAHHLLGNMYFTRKEYEKAEKAYKKAVKGMPRDARPRNNLAWLYYVKGENLKDARKLAEEAVVLARAGQKAAYIDTMDKIDEALAEK